jgi:hypothetical protein
MHPQWLEWAQRLQAIAQNGLTYSDNHFDQERYQAVRDIAAEIMAAYSETGLERVRDLFSNQIGAATPKVDVRGALFKAVAFFPEHEIPELSLTRVMPAQIARLFEHHRHPDWLTDFD